MKTLAFNLTLLACLTMLPFTVSADGRYDRGSWSNNGVDFRLGGFRGGNRGYEIFFRYRDGRGWRRAPGSAMDLGDGWVIGTDRRRGGYGIYRWNGRGWTRMPGAGVRIGGSYNRPWIVNDRGQRYFWNGRGWNPEGRVNRRSDRNPYSWSAPNRNPWQFNDRDRGRRELRNNSRNQRYDRNNNRNGNNQRGSGRRR